MLNETASISGHASERRSPRAHEASSSTRRTRGEEHSRGKQQQRHEQLLQQQQRERRRAPSLVLETVLRLKAVRSFFDELDKAEGTAAAEGGERDVTSATNRSKNYGLVLTRKFSGRMQTGCVGGCFR